MKNIFILTCFLLVACDQAPEVVILTDKGEVEGVFNKEETVRVFKGIPFAAPPVGDFRWKAPQPTKSWEGVLQCFTFGASPIQNDPKPFYCWSEEFIAKPEPISEDCLYLNIWTTARSKNEKQPVLVWIYGGGMTSGSSNCDIYDGEEMAKKGVVFISINYRVGIIGFMAHPELTNESGYAASGNYGLLDQIAALQWIKKNIDAFGGDPDNVTIAGQSAGAYSVNSLIASPLSGGVFHKAILQSGGILSNSRIQDLADAEAMGLRFMEKAEVNTIEELRQIPADRIQEISNDPEIGRVGICRDNYVLPVDLMQNFKNGKQQQVPIIAGWVLGDGDFQAPTEMTVEEYKAEARTNYGNDSDTYLDVFPAATNQEVKIVKSKIAMLSFAGVTSHLIADHNTQASYLYQFGHVPPDKPNFPNYGAFHTSEVPYTLHTLNKWNRDWRPADRKIEETLSSYWANFAKTGDPNGDGLPRWAEYNRQSGSIMVIENEAFGSKKEYLKREFNFLENL